MLYTLKDIHKEFKKDINNWIKNNKNSVLDKNTIESLKENNINGFLSPKEFDFSGKDFTYFSLAIEEISKVNRDLSFSIISNYIFEQAISIFGTNNQKIKYLEKLYNKDYIASFAIFDEKNDYNINNINTNFTIKDDKYILNGKKYVEYNLINSDYILIFAKDSNTNPNNKENINLSAFIINKNIDGISIKDNTLILENVELEDNNLLGKLNDGNEIIYNLFINSHIALDAHFLGLSKHINEIINKKFKDDNLYIKDSKYNKDYLDLISRLKSNDLFTYNTSSIRSNGIDNVKDLSFSYYSNLSLSKDFVNFYLNLENDKNIKEQFRKDIDNNFNNIFNSDLQDIKKLLLDFELNNKKEFNQNNAYQKLNKNSINNIKSDNRKQIVYEKIDNISINNISSIILDSMDKDNDNFNIYDDINNSNITLCVGLGIEDKENIDIIERFAKLINATISCTRPISEELEWMDTSRYIGSTGSKFYNNLYIGIGLSGSVHHLEGIKDAKNIIAINTDKHAKIFSNCDYGIVGDLKEIVPLLEEKIKDNL